MPLLPEHSAPQHERAPRPLPLFLELVREVSERNPDLARAALAGLRAYEHAPRPKRSNAKPEVARVRGAALRDQGGSGPPVLLIPSLINPPRILDLDEQVSLTAAIALMGRHVLLLDWGKADERSSLSVADHVEELLIPLLERIEEPVALIGYCLGGTMAIAAASYANVERVVTIATPWHFDRYPEESRRALAAIWRTSEAAARQIGALPMEVLQAAFWSIDPHRTVGKFADFGRLDPSSPEAHRFVELEEWANEGESLPYPAARELIEGMFGENLPGSSRWNVAGEPATEKLAVPSFHFVAEHDRIAPVATAPVGKQLVIPSGHVGMIVGSGRHRLHDGLRTALEDER